MTFASGSNRGAAYVAETTFGETPASPTMALLRNTGMNLNQSSNHLQTEMINENRQLDYLRRGTFNTAGDIPFEMIYGHYDELIEAVMCGTWSTDTLKCGSTFRSFTIEDRFKDISQYRVFTGEVMDTFSLSVAPGDSGSYVTGSFGTMGKAMTVNSTETASPTDPGSNVPMTTCDGVIKVEGSPVQVFNSFELSIANNYAANYVIGGCSPESMTQGQIEVTGTLGAYLEDKSQVDKFLNETDTSLTLELTDPAGNKLTFDLPKVNFTGADVDTNAQALNQSIPFTAIYDTTDESTLVISRTSA